MACPSKSNQTKPDFGTLLSYILCARVSPRYAMAIKSNQTKPDFGTLLSYILCATASTHCCQLIEKQLSNTAPKRQEQMHCLFKNRGLRACRLGGLEACRLGGLQAWSTSGVRGLQAARTCSMLRGVCGHTVYTTPLLVKNFDLAGGHGWAPKLKYGMPI
jgi:hypothetical protein